QRRQLLALPSLPGEQCTSGTATPSLPPAEAQHTEATPGPQGPPVPGGAMPLRGILDGDASGGLDLLREELPFHWYAIQRRDHDGPRVRPHRPADGVDIGSERAGVHVIERDPGAGADRRRREVVALERRQGDRTANALLRDCDGDLQGLRATGRQFDARSQVSLGDFGPQGLHFGWTHQRRPRAGDAAQRDGRVDRELPPDHRKRRFSHFTKDLPSTPRAVSRTRLVARVRVTAGESPSRSSTSAGALAASASRSASAGSPSTNRYRIPAARANAS